METFTLTSDCIRRLTSCCFPLESLSRKARAKKKEAGAEEAGSESSRSKGGRNIFLSQTHGIDGVRAAFFSRIVTPVLVIRGVTMGRANAPIKTQSFPYIPSAALSFLLRPLLSFPTTYMNFSVPDAAAAERRAVPAAGNSREHWMTNEMKIKV